MVISNEIYTATIIQVACASISIIACVAMVVMYFMVKELQSNSFKIIIFLMLVDLEWSILILVSGAVTLGEVFSITMCEAVYCLQIQCGLLSLFTSSVIAIDLYIATYRQPRYMDIRQITFILVLSTVLAIIPASITHDSFKIVGINDNLCMIQPLYALFLFFLPMAICLIINFTCVLITFNKINQFANNKVIRNYLTRLFIYPTIILIVFIPPTIQEIFLMFGLDAVPPWVAYFLSVLQSLLGFFDSLAYCVTAVRNQLNLRDSVTPTTFGDSVDAYQLESMDRKIFK